MVEQESLRGKQCKARVCCTGAKAVHVLVAAMMLVCALVALGCGASGGQGAGGAQPPAQAEAKGLVFDASANTWYESVSDAFSNASSGDVLYLYGDSAETALKIDANGVTVDLQGHTLTVDAKGSGAPGKVLSHAGIAYEGDAELVIRNGGLTVELGGAPETTQSATTPYRGIDAQGGGGVRLAHMDVTVKYAGESTVEPAVSLQGVASDGNLVLEDETELHVASASRKGAYGASTAVGAYSFGIGENVSVELSADSRISVDNVSKLVMQGQLGYPGAIFGTTKADNSELIEVALDPSLPWYDELQSAFLAKASFDDADDDAGYVHGAELYYLTAHQLETGPVVWAYSDPVSASEAGRLEHIQADHVFVRSDFALPLDAYGIWCQAEGYESIVQAGAIEVATTSGHAYGTYVPEAASAECDDAVVKAECGTTAFRAQVGAFNLADYIDGLQGKGDALVYPANSAAVSVRLERPSAQAIVYAGQEPRVFDDAPVAFADLMPEWDERAEAVAAAEAAEAEAAAESDEAQEQEEETEIGLTLCYYRMGRDGYMYTWESVGSFIYTEDLDFMDAANECVRIGDTVEVEGVTYRFLGWSPRRTDREPVYTEHLYAGRNLGGFRGDKVTYYGIYEVLENRYTVKFVVDGTEYAESSDLAGATTLYAAFSAAGKDRPVDAGGRAFSGWALDPKADHALYDGIATVSELAGESGSTEVTVYALWGDVQETEKPVSQGSSSASGSGADGGKASTASEVQPAAGAQAGATAQDTADTATQQPSQLPGLILLVAFMVMVAACAFAWASHGRALAARASLMALDADGQSDTRSQQQDPSHGKGGLRF